MSSQGLATTENNNNELAHTNIQIPEDAKVFGEITIADIKESSIGIVNREILLARFSQKPIRDLDANFSGENIKSVINLTIFESGFKTEDIDKLILMVIKDIFSDFGYMTLPEVSLAFRKGVRGDFGEIMGMSVRTFYSWLKKYNQTVKIDAIKALQGIKKDTTKQISSQEKQAYHLKWLKSRVDEFERHKKGEKADLYDFGNIFYGYCIKNGIAYFSEEEKRELWMKAKDNIVANHSIEKAKSTYQARDYKDIVTSINKSKMDDSTMERVKSEYKRLAIPMIYDKLIKENINLADVFDAIENTKKE